MKLFSAHNLKNSANTSSGLCACSVTLLVSLLLIPAGVHAQAAPQRLSDWLLEHAPTPNEYPLGLSWRVPDEVAAQNKLRADLLHSLSGQDVEVKANPEALQRLRDFVITLPVTGRVPVALADGHWLQANPARDPVLLPDHSVILPTRPATVTVLTSAGRLCTVRHLSGRLAMDYVHVCEPGATQAADWAWIAQPDGKIQRFGVASWNLQAQDEPAPGAWLWAPPRNGLWPEKLSQQLLAFLATQGPAPDNIDGAPGTGAHDDILLPSAAAMNSSALRVTSDDWGSVGLLQSPTTRMRPTGDLAVHASNVYPYTSLNVFAQPFEALEVGFRYTSVSNRLYGPAIAGDQAYKDKSIDAKLQLNDESAYWPQVAVGLRDLAGTGLFSGEYVVANKRHNNFDWSLGVGWGYMGARGDLRNPLESLDGTFNTRPLLDVGQGGNLAFGNYFRGPAALFGGVQYQTPWEPLILKLEYDGNDYQHQAQNNNLPQASPWNFGAVYQASSSVDFSFAIERGNTAMVGMTLHASLSEMSMPKLSDPARLPVTPIRPQQAPDWVDTSRTLEQQTDWPVKNIEQGEHELRVTLDDADAGYWRDHVDRAAAVLHRDAPEAIDRFTLAYREHGVEVAEHHIDRDAWVEQQIQALPPSAQREAVIASAPGLPEQRSVVYQGTRPGLDSGLGMNLNYSLGGPDSFMLYQISATEKAKLRLTDNTWLQGGLQLGLLDNYDLFKYTAPSNLPRVRTYAREFMTTSRLTMPNLQLTHAAKLGGNNYFSVYGGYLENMYAGAGTEWLYRPFESRLAFGVDVNAVIQRDFRQDFSLRDYRVATGHATLYWDTGWKDVQAQISAGRYLAEDLGVTMEFSRSFQNGVSVGAAFTKTNVSAEQFGEGSMDKWLFITIPFDAMLTRSSSSVAHVKWKPLTRDGGAKLERAFTLYDMTKALDQRTLQYEPAPPPNKVSIPEDRRESWSLPTGGIEPYRLVTEKVSTQQWNTDKEFYEQRLFEALHRQQFRNIQIQFDGSDRLSISLSNNLIKPASRAIGRAVRTALLNAPVETRRIHIAFAETAAPFKTEPYPYVSYDFNDLPRLQHYLHGEISSTELAHSVTVNYLAPAIPESDPLVLLRDEEAVSGEQSLMETLTPDVRLFYRVKNDLVNAADYTTETSWFKAGAIGTGLVLASSMLDNSADNFALNHAQSSWLKGVNTLGNVAVPLAAFAGAAVFALDSDPVRSRTGFAALEAGGTALLLSTGMKHVAGRARPFTGLGNNSFEPFSGSADNGTDGFPSGHTMIVWSVLTPFAEEYDAPWLYGVASLTNLARVGSRNHWVSDTVASSLLGYGIGKIFWESSRKPHSNYPKVDIVGRGISLTWDTP